MTITISGVRQSLPHRVRVAGAALLAPVTTADEFAVLDAPCAREVLGHDRTRRLDPFSQQALVAVEQARTVAGLSRPLPNAETEALEGVVVGSAFAANVTTVRYAKRLISDGTGSTAPIDFPDSIDGAAAAHVALDLRLGGPNLTLSEGPSSAVAALVTAARLIATGKATRMHVVMGDILDEFFREAFREAYRRQEIRFAEAVFAVVLEPLRERDVPENCLELAGFDHREPRMVVASRHFLDANGPNDKDEAVLPMRNPSGALDVAEAWLRATHSSCNAGVQDGASNALKNKPSATGREVKIANSDYPNLRYLLIST